MGLDVLWRAFSGSEILRKGRERISGEYSLRRGMRPQDIHNFGIS